MSKIRYVLLLSRTRNTDRDFNRGTENPHRLSLAHLRRPLGRYGSLLRSPAQGSSSQKKPNRSPGLLLPKTTSLFHMKPPPSLSKEQPATVSESLSGELAPVFCCSDHRTLRSDQLLLTKLV